APGWSGRCSTGTNRRSVFTAGWARCRSMGGRSTASMTAQWQPWQGTNPNRTLHRRNLRDGLRNFFERGLPMQTAYRRAWLLWSTALALALVQGSVGEAACCYFSAKNADILQPAQKAFLTWDPVEQVETFTVQPKFEGNALDFGMVIPTPAQPKLDEMPRDFFKELAVLTILKKREQPHSKLLYLAFP